MNRTLDMGVEGGKRGARRKEKERKKEKTQEKRQNKREDAKQWKKGRWETQSGWNSGNDRVTMVTTR